MNTTFDESLARFQHFLEKNGYSRDVVWIAPRDLILTSKRLLYVKLPVAPDNERLARELFDLGIRSKRGILFETVCCANDIAFCHAWVPANDSERQRFLLPEGLKVSAQTIKRDARVVHSSLHWFLLGMRHANYQEFKRNLFNLNR